MGTTDRSGHQKRQRTGARGPIVNRKSQIVNRAGERAYTLVEILVVCAIIGIVCTLAIPMLHHKLHPDSMQKAVTDITEACTLARASAILNGAPIDFVIGVEDDNSMSVTLQAAAGRSPGSRTGEAESDSATMVTSSRSSGGGGAPSFSGRISDKIAVELVEVNFQDAMDWAEVRVRFYPNGTCDEFKLLLYRPDTNERRKITLETVTALVDVESDLNKMRE